MVSTRENYIENVDENEQKVKREKLPFGHYKVNHRKASKQSEISYYIEGIEKLKEIVEQTRLFVESEQTMYN